MSDNTIIYITERKDRLWDISMHWMEDDFPEFERFRQEGITLDSALDIANHEYSEYGYKIIRLKDQERQEEGGKEKIDKFSGSQAEAYAQAQDYIAKLEAALRERSVEVCNSNHYAPWDMCSAWPCAGDRVLLASPKEAQSNQGFEEEVRRQSRPDDIT